jgi:hypothetical protein
MSLSKEELTEIKKLLLTPGLTSNDVARTLGYGEKFIRGMKYQLAMGVICGRYDKDDDEFYIISNALGIPTSLLRHDGDPTDYQDGPMPKLNPNHPLTKEIESVELMNDTIDEDEDEDEEIDVAKELKSLRQEIQSLKAELARTNRYLIQVLNGHIKK